MRAVLHAVVLTVAVLAPAESLDWRVQRAVQSARRPGLEGPMRFATEMGKPVLVAGALVALALLDRAQGVATLRAAAVALIPTNLAVEGIKRATFRTRPDGERKASNASFPSSHAANAFAIAWVLARRWRRAAPAWFAVAVVVTISRVYLNRHFLSDVVVGAAIGTLCGWWATRRPPARAAGPPGSATSSGAASG